jgi:hypothetical protein
MYKKYGLEIGYSLNHTFNNNILTFHHLHAVKGAILYYE